MFSIIIPLYNKAPYVRKAIESVLSQTYQEFEVIVVDDGSTDDSLSNAQFIIHNLELQEPDKFKKIKIVQQENQGVSTTRNNGVKLAKYDYIAFLDADDWWEPTYLEEMKALIAKYPGAGMYSSSYYKIKESQKIVARIGVDSAFTDGIINYFDTYRKTMWMPVWTGAVIIRKNYFLEEGGFRKNLKIGEDFDLWIRLALKYPVIFLNTPLSNYNQDVDYVNRAAHGKLHAKESDFLFNTDIYSQSESENNDLKRLLDKHRIMHLKAYYFNNERKQDAYHELSKVDWNLQPLNVRLLYNQPYIIGKALFQTQYGWGIVKQRIKRLLRK